MTNEKQNISVSFGTASKVANVQIGNSNQMDVSGQQIAFTAPDAVNIDLQLAELREILDRLEPSTEISEQMRLAESEASLANPDKDKIGNRIKEVLQYISGKSTDIVVTKSLEAIFVGICSWLGSDWHRLMEANIFQIPR